ncbi:MAG: DUF58 domain-containing protein [Coriobacteriia bacterium]|nr:DUF58 domain-containing protein [Coriobacteriia bacterium]
MVKNPIGNLRSRLGRKGKAAGDWRSDAGFKRHRLLKALVCLVVFCLLLAPVFFVNHPIGYLPPLMMVFLLALSYGYLRLTARSITFGGISSKGTCPRNTQAKFLVRFRNDFVLPVTRVDATFRVSSSYGTDDVLKRFSLSLEPRASKDFEYGICFAHVGRIQLGVQEVTVHDPLGLFALRLPDPQPQVVEVTPRQIPVSDEVIRNLEMSESVLSMTPFQKDGMDYMGVREYAMGDPMKTIHWKISSRTGTLHTKLYESSGNPGIDVLCDLHSSCQDQAALMSVYDSVMELGTSLHQFGRHHSLRTELLFFDALGELCRITDHDEIDFHDLLERMPLPSPERDENELPQLLRDVSGSTFADANMIVVTSCISDRMVVAIREAKERGKTVSLLLIVPSELDPEEQRALRAPLASLGTEGVRCALFDPSADVEEVCFG